MKLFIDPALKTRLSLLLASALFCGFTPLGTARAAGGSWSNPVGGSWTNSANWNGGVIADGAGSTADFSALSLPSDALVTLDFARAIGNLTFDDQSATKHNWSLGTGGAGPLTLAGATPTITVGNPVTTISAAITGAAGLMKAGGGKLVLAGTNTVAGSISNTAGTLALGTVTLSADGVASAYAATLGVVSGAVIESSGTLYLNCGNAQPELEINGAGTLRLTSTSNSAASPDLYFGKNYSGTSYWGERISTPLDLGNLQRYIWGTTSHASVDKYGVANADIQFAGPISGSGGMTFIAQMSYTGSGPMEVPFCLNAANTFTGPVEIRRGSVYLGAANAFPAGNVLRFNVASGYNGKFFLYGKSATVSDLSSTGAGTAWIVNGNRNPSSIAAATLTIIQNNPGTFAGTIINTNVEYPGSGGTATTTLSLVKNGAAALTLTGKTAFTGTLAVNAGKLYINTLSSGGGAVTVAGGATLGGSGTNAAPVTVASGGVLEAGDGTGFGRLTLKGLTLGSSPADTSTLYVTRNNNPAIIAVTNNNGLVVNSGAGTVTINVGGAAPAVGQYPLITYSGTLGGTGFGAFTLGSLPPRVTATLVNNTTGHSIDLNVTAVDFPSWSGAVSTEWSVNSLALPKNWVLNSDGITPTDYQTGDTAMFTDAATGTTVDVSVADVLPAGVVFNHSAQNFTLTGSKAIAGTAGLSKAGSGTLTILNNNTYSGQTTISAGAVQVGNGGNAGSLGTGAVANNGSLVFNRADTVSVSGLSGAGTLQQSGPGTLTILGSDTLTGPTTIAAGVLQVGSGGAVTAFGNGPVINNSSLVFNSSSSLSVPGVISGPGSVAAIAAGAITLGGTNTYAGGTTINGGTVNLTNAFGLGSGNVTITSGALNFTFPSGSSNVVANNLSLPLIGTQEFIIQGPTALTTVRLTGLLSGGSAGQSYRLVDSNVGSDHYDNLVLDNPNNSFQGIINLWRGSLGITSDGALGNPNNGIFIDVGNGNGGLRFDANNLVLASSRAITLNGTEVINPQSYTATLTGPLVVTGGLNKPGAGALVLAGPVTGNGAVNIQSGTLQIGNGGASGTLSAGAVTVGTNAILSFNRSDAIIVGNLIGGVGSLAQNGAGSLTLTAANSYSGPTLVNAGSLVVNGSLSATNAVTVVSNATLAGKGAITGPVVLSGSIAPGVGVGLLSTGSQTWNGGGSYLWEISTKLGAAGTNWDLLKVAGGIDLEAGSTNPFTIKILPSAAIDFSKDTAQAFTLATFTGAVTNFNPTAFVIDTSAFTTDLAGGGFFVSTNPGALVLNFTNIQPPSIGSLEVSSTNLLLDGKVRIVVHATDPNLNGTLSYACDFLGSGVFAPLAANVMEYAYTNAGVYAPVFRVQDNFGKLAPDQTVVLNVGAAQTGSSNALGTPLSALVGSGVSYAGLAAYAYGSNGSWASLQGGSNLDVAEKTVAMSWRDRTPMESNYLYGAVVEMSGVGSNAADLYVAQMTYDPAQAGAAPVCLSWYDGAAWVKAVEGSTGAVANYLGRNHPFDPAADLALGNYGSDDATRTAWAVVNQPGDFSVAALNQGPQWTLTVVSAQDSPIPAIGSHNYADGRPVLCQIQNPVMTLVATQYVCQGWQMAGNEPRSGTGSSFTFAPTNNAALTWLWGTNYWLQLGTTGGGALARASAWYAAGSNVVVNALSSYTTGLFQQWAGDTNGCLFSGTRITIPMDRARGPITGQFLRTAAQLTVVSDHPACAPAPGAYSYPQGTLLTNRAFSQTVGAAQYVCAGWTMSGDAPHVGTTNSYSMTLTRDSVLTWLWTTNYWLTTSASSGGTVSAASGWQPAGGNVLLVAQPIGSNVFQAWSGDTNGCVIGADHIIVPMSGPRGPVTANFIPDENFTVVALPDTQNYSSASPGSSSYLWTNQTMWVTSNIAAKNIKFLTHLGDVVNTYNNATEWSHAVIGMDVLNGLNGSMAYGIVPGNHDIANGDTHYLDNFGPNHPRWKDAGGNRFPWHMGWSPRGYSSWQMITVATRKYIFLDMDIDTPDDDIAWAQSILNTNRNTLVFMTTHDWLCETGGSGSTGSGNGQRSRVHVPYISVSPTRHSADYVYTNLVAPNNEIFWVICGHNFAQYSLPDTNNAGNVVNQIICDYQTLPNGGNAFLRLMEFRPSQKQVYSTTYSPSLGRSMNTSSADQTGMLDLTDPNGYEFATAFDFDHRFDGKLRVQFAGGPADLSIATNAYPPGTAVLNSAPSVQDGQTLYTAAGWTLSGSQSASGAGNAATLVMNGNATLAWSWNTNYWLETGEIGNGQVSQYSGWRPAGAPLTLSALPLAGATFLRWSGDLDGCTVDGTNITVPMNRAYSPITAEFSTPIPNYVLTIVSDQDSVSPAPGVYSYAPNDTASCAAQNNVLGSTQQVCIGWTASTGDSGTGNTVDLAMTGDITLTWLWQTQYQLQTQIQGPGAVDAAAGWYPANTPVRLHASPVANAHFVQWSGDLAGCTVAGDTLTVPMDRAYGPITAVFEFNQFTLTVVSDHGTPAPMVGTLVTNYGSFLSNSVLNEVIGSTQYVCVGWTLQGQEPAAGVSNTVSFVLTNNATLTWLWQTQVLLTVASDGHGVITPMAADGWQVLGTTVPLHAQPEFWSRFDHWSGDAPAGASTPDLALLMDAPKSVTANFGPKQAVGGTPAWWLARNGLVSGGSFDLAESLDVDGDGMTAGQEFLAGTDPNNAQSTLKISLVLSNPPPGSLSWASVPGWSYSLLASTNLAQGFVNWSNLAALDTQTTVTLPNLSPALAAWFRVSATPPSSAWTQPPQSNAVLRAMALIPAGTFIMGDSQYGGGIEYPQHPVTLTTPYYMDVNDVTVGEWTTVCLWAATNGYDLNPVPQFTVPATHPIQAVSWYDSVKWCNARSEMEGRVPAYYTDAAGQNVYRTGQIDLVSSNVNWAGNGYRLPTEAEWERAARGGLPHANFPWGDTVSASQFNVWQYWVEVLNYQSPTFPWTTPVGYFNGNQVPPGPNMTNGFGLYDMAGNVWQWCWDRYSDYSPLQQFDPTGSDAGDRRINRGGSWWNNVDDARTAKRYPYTPLGDTVYGSIGFRCVCRGSDYTVAGTNLSAAASSPVASLTYDQPPTITSALAASTWQNQPLTLSVGKLLQHAADPDGDPFLLSAVSPASQQGGTVTTANNTVTFLPAANFLGDDQFTYTVTDNRGGFAIGTVTVSVLLPQGSGPNILGVSADATTATIRLAGIPGFVYQVQASTDLTNWVNIGWAAAGANGLFQFVDTDKNLYPMRFYRVVQAQTPTATIASISDIHYMDPSLLISDGAAFQNYLAQDRKMLAQSKALLEAAISGISNAQPNILLVSGDLTKDGELVSHLAVSNYLWSLKASGMKVFVCPGNHDVSNPQARSFDGASSAPVPNISANDFAAIYGPFGFNDAIARDSNSLSYVVEPVPGLWILSMDSCRYDQNSTQATSSTGGFLDAGRWQFITNQLALGRARGKFVLGMEHHPIMEHFAGMQTLFPEYVLTNYQAVDQAFASYGMKVVFTGHFHAQDVIRANLPAGALFDIETGSTVTYPSPYRLMNLASNGVLTVNSYPITNINYDLGGQDFPTFAKGFLQQGLMGLSTYMLTSAPYSLPLAQAQQLAPAMTEAFMSHYQGDESTRPISPQTQGTIAYLSGVPDPRFQFMAFELNALFHDPAPADNNVTLNLITGEAAP